MIEKAAEEGITEKRLEKPENPLSWIAIHTFVAVDFHRDLDLGLSLVVLKSPEEMFRGFVQVTTDKGGLALGIDLGRLLRYEALSILEPTFFVNYMHSLDTDLEKFGVGVSVAVF